MKFVFDKRHYTSAISDRNARIFDFVPRNKFRDKMMIELGAGIGLPGGDFEKLGATVVSVEGRRANIEEGRKRFPKRDWHQMDFSKDLLPMPGCFDYVLCLGLLYHLPNPEKLIQEMPGCLRGTGTVFISTIVCDSDDVNLINQVTSRGQKENHDHHLADSQGSRFSYAWFEKQLKATGMSVVDITPRRRGSWCFWLHEKKYVNDGEFRRKDHAGHCRKMYMCSIT
jgi:2-polyprenyl-3-methyl-5-hydroxy-6-metoxy-1,4-benzoquinol methylase